jgi:pyruvate kinase
MANEPVSTRVPVRESGGRDRGDAATELTQLLREVRGLRRDLVAAAVRQAAEIDAVLPRHRYSATNLVHYVELRSRDVRDLQSTLSHHGLTSLGRTEAHVLRSIDALLGTLCRLTGVRGSEAESEDDRDVDALVSSAAFPPREPAGPGTPTAPEDGAALLAQNTVTLLGARPASRGTRIMVTLPSSAAADPAMVRRMVENGMNLARVNCAHDGPETWAAMISHVRAAAASTGLSCRVAMDLAGPKLRTGPIRPGPQVLKSKPERSATGAVLRPALLWLGARGDDPAGAAGAAGAPVTPVVPVFPGDWAGARRVGEAIRLVDARGRGRTLTVERVQGGGCLVSVRRTAYLVPGTVLTVVTPVTPVTTDTTVTTVTTVAPDRVVPPHSPTATVGALPATPLALRVRRGDEIVLTADLTPATPTDNGRHRIGCTLPAVFADARVGERVLLDDGKIGGVITATGAHELTLKVLFAGVSGTNLRAEKGINVPDTRLRIGALTGQDRDNLPFVAAHADVVDVSFVRSANDVAELLDALDTVDAVDGRRLGIVLKIETVAGFDALPQILLSALRREDVGVMIARGDLAVETGFERLAEVQEEILWLCEAAHVPVIWATQVLDTLARTGLPSRAEVTDAAMAERAECVMLNKGPYIDEAISMLAGILTRMQNHTQKKRSMLRRLRAWDLDTPPE